jgi:non-lysosomal glucosylceramidase
MRITVGGALGSFWLPFALLGGGMRFRRGMLAAACAVLMGCAASALIADEIPKAAWRRPIGQPLENAGTSKPALGSGHIDDGYWQGAPVGGFGSGTFSRTFRGDFARWHLQPGVHRYQTVYANQFAMFQKSEDEQNGVARVLFTGHPQGGALKSWSWDYPVGAGEYAALYPKSWFDYKWDKFPVHVTVEQFSPILPDNYKETSDPVAVYRWHAENPTKKKITVSVLLSWTNMMGWLRGNERNFRDGMNEGNFNSYRSEKSSEGMMKGVLFERKHAGKELNAWDGQMTIAAMESSGVEISYVTTFSPDRDGSDVWNSFAKDGALSNSNVPWLSSGEPLAGAIAVKFTLEPGEKKVIPMVVAWDFPVVEFGEGRKWNRRYTDFYGTSGENAWAMARDGLQNARKWSEAIDAWQAPYINDESKPLWYRGMLFNELYVFGDLGSFWGRPVGADTKTPSTYSFMECFDYPFYETLDVRFYGSMALAKFWPEIDKQVMRAFADTVPQELSQRMIWQWKSDTTGNLTFRTRKRKGAVPHDLGVPAEDPFFQVNQFSWQDTNGWKDLNSKFVLMIYRDYVLSGSKDKEFLRYTWPAIQEALVYLGKFDRDGDGIPDNDGYPDQTYDTWLVRGDSAYSGSLWLASLRAAEEIAKKLGDGKAAAHYNELFAKGQKSYIAKLWNGKYFRYDTESEYKDNIQADQLAGQWYADVTGLGDIVPREMRSKALRNIYDYNVMKFANGEMGAVNGIAADGTLITSNEQVQEVWTGTTLALAGFMLGEGMKEEAFHTAWGIYHVSYETKGYWFRTPEAWDITGNYRASMYMRPAAIWAMEMTAPPQESAGNREPAAAPVGSTAGVGAK